MTKNRRVTALISILGLVALAALAGCGVREIVRGDIQPPRVSLQAVTLGRPASGGWPLICTLLVDNPNPQALNVLGYDYELWLEGRSVAQGASDQAVHLPPQGQALVEFPVQVKLQALLQGLPLFLQHQKIRYQIAGGVRLASLLGGFRVPFRFQGELTPKEGLEQLRPYLK